MAATISYGSSSSPSEGDPGWYTLRTGRDAVTTYGINPNYIATYPEDPQERPMPAITDDAVRKARSELREEQAKQLLADVEGEFAEFDLTPGTVVTASVEFPDKDKTYQYAWIKGEKSWYRTFSSTVYTTEMVVDEIVHLTLESSDMGWSIRNPI